MKTKINLFKYTDIKKHLNKKGILAAFHIFKNNFELRAVLLTSFSTLNNILFAIINAIVGIVTHSVWSISIFFYYMFLAVIRDMIFSYSYKKYKNKKYLSEKSVYIVTHTILLVLNISLIVPMSVMVQGNRNYDFGLTIAIIFAAYTFYRLTVSIINYKKTIKIKNLLVSEITAINVIDSLVSLLTLQNALIFAANGYFAENMKKLTEFTCGLIFAVIVIISVASFLRIKKYSRSIR